jgi:hypothetical protein
MDGEQKGKTPLSIEDIAPGEHTMELRKKGHFLKKAKVSVPTGTEREVTFTLTKPVRLVVTSKPSGAKVALNGDSSGVTPYVNDKLKPKDYTLTLSLDGHADVTRSVALTAKDRDSVHVTLEPGSAKKAGAQDTPAKAVKKGRLSVIDKVALGVFLTFSVVILVVELASTKD